MKLSTIFKVAATVVTVCTAGIVIHEVVKKREETPTTINEEKNEESVEVIEESEVNIEVRPVVKKVATVAVGCVAMLLALPLASELAYRKTVTKLAVNAIDKGVLTLDILAELANGEARLEEV